MGSSKSKSTTNPTVQAPWGPQAGALEGLYGQANTALGQLTGGPLQGQAQQTFMNLMNPGVNPQLQAYQNQVNRNFTTQTMPTINAATQGAGQALGTSRGAIAGQEAGLQANQQVADMAANLYGQDMNRALAAASGYGQAMMSPYAQMAGILGVGPTVLSSGGGGKSKGKSWTL